MKKVYIFVLLVFVCACAGKRGMEPDPSCENEYDKGKLVSLVCYYEDGAIKGTFKSIDDNIFEITTYHENGMVFSDWHYGEPSYVKVFDAEGRLISTHYTFEHKSYSVYYTYFNGVLYSESTYIEQKRHGIEKVYNPDSSLLMEYNYVNDELDGVQKDYRDDYQLIRIYKKGEVIGGYCLTKETNDIIPLLAEEILNNSYQCYKDGSSCDKGRSSEIHYGEQNYIGSFDIKGRPTYLNYIIDGKSYTMINLYGEHLYAEVVYINQDRHGADRVYNADGSLSSERYYVNGELDGIQNNYWDDFQLISIYEKGTIMGGYCLMKDTNEIIPLSVQEISNDIYDKCYK